MLSGKIRGNEHKPKHRMLPLNIRKLFILSGTEHWHRLPVEAVESSLLEIFKSSPKWPWATGYKWPFLSRGLCKRTSRGPSQPQPVCDFVTLWNKCSNISFLEILINFWESVIHFQKENCSVILGLWLLKIVVLGFKFTSSCLIQKKKKVCSQIW